MILTDVENLLAERLGFDIQTIGPDAVGSVIQKCMEEAGFSDPAAYARILANDPEKWSRLVDRVVIPETWFFRDTAPFELAADVARTHMRKTPGKVFRILSCPCSTGEEPYSLAIAMLNTGAPAESFIVDAVDVSRLALESAQDAVFRTRSFREDAQWYRESYFDDATGGSWRLRSSVASAVRFRQGNLIESGFLQDEAPYDLVFSRNLLIYLHSSAKLRAVAALRRLVAENGVLVVGHAEAAFAREHGFKPTGPISSFAFIRKHNARAVLKAPPLRRHNVAPSVPSVVPARPPSAMPTNRGVDPVGAPLPSQLPELSLLEKARQLGDAGQLHEALRACSQYLKSIPNSAEGYFLLGVLQDALGQAQLAAGSFRKVLYLEPAHREALLHLALKREALGDGSGAALLRARARRAEDASTAE